MACKESEDMQSAWNLMYASSDAYPTEIMKNYFSVHMIQAELLQRGIQGIS